MVNWDMGRPCSWDIFIIFILFFSTFLKGHQELSVNTLDAIFEDIMSMW